MHATFLLKIQCLNFSLINVTKMCALKKFRQRKEGGSIPSVILLYKKLFQERDFTLNTISPGPIVKRNFCP